MDERVLKALSFLLLPSAERARQDVMSVLDDEVMNELLQRGLTELRTVDRRDVPDGALVATDGNGGLALVEVTIKGRAMVEGSR